MKIFKGVIKGLIFAIAGVILLFALFIGALAISERIIFNDFYSNAEKLEKIPAAWDKYVPQGYIFHDDIRLGCGYMSDGSASRVYITDDESEPICVELKNADGSDYTGHTGGIDVYGNNVYITGSKGCDVFSLSDILDGDGTATQLYCLETINDPAYCVIKDGVLYSGSFYREGNYETPASHRMTTPAGDKNTAIIAAYSLEDGTAPTQKQKPDFVISTCGLVQGMTFIDDTTVVLATSYGTAKSHLYVYDLEKMSRSADGFDIDGESVPLYYLDSASLAEDISAPPMAEQIVYDNGRIYIMHESASMKYIFGKFTCGPYVYGYKYSK